MLRNLTVATAVALGYTYYKETKNMETKMDKVVGGLVIALGAVLLIVAIAGIFSYFVMLLWNGCLVAAVDGVHQIGWLQAWGISILFGMLFKGSNYSAKSE